MATVQERSKLTPVDRSYSEPYKNYIGYNCPRIAFAGDSITAITPYSTASALGNHPYAPSSWLLPMLGQRARTDPTLIFGVSGDTSTQLLARIDAVCNSVADIVVILIGTNDINNASGTTLLSRFTTYKSNMLTMIDRLIAAGKTVIIQPPLPRNVATAENRNILIQMRNWTNSLAWIGKRNLFIADASVDYGDPLSTTYAPRSGYDYDGLHPQARGAYEISKSLYRVLDKILPPFSQQLFSVADVYEATYNPTGNLLTNGILDGTSGTKSTTQGLTPTGDVATSWGTSFSAPYSGGTALSGLTVVSSKGVTTDGRIENILTVSGSYTGDVDSYFGISQAVASLSRIQAGDAIEAMGEIVLDVSAAELPLVSPRITMAMTFPTATAFRVSDMHHVALGYSPKEGYTMLMRTPRYVVPETPSILSFGAHMIPRQGANTLPNNAVIRFRSMSLRKII